MTKEEKRNDWIAKVAEFLKTGSSQADWCRSKNIERRKFNYWVLRYKHEIPQENNKNTNWIEVKTNEVSVTPATSLTIKIGKAIIEVNSDFDCVQFQKIAQILNALC